MSEFKDYSWNEDADAEKWAAAQLEQISKSQQESQQNNVQEQ